LSKRESDAELMRRCLALARRGLGWTSPNPLVGCVIVRGGEVLAEGAHLELGGLHAERAALLSLSSAADRAAGVITPGCAKGAALYCNLEPCSHEGRQPPCVNAIIAAGISVVVWGADDADPRSAGCARAILEAAGIEVVSGVLEDECRDLNDAFYHRHSQPQDRPGARRRAFVAIKAAVSADGRIAGPGGAPAQITGPQARAYAHELRQKYDAILIGAGTLRMDDPLLTVRPDVLAADGIEIERPRDPAAIVVTASGDLPPEAKLFRAKRAGRIRDCETGDAQVIVAAPDDAVLPELPPHVSVLRVERLAAGGFDWQSLFEKLPEMGIYSVLVEGGAKVWSALLEREFWDRLLVFKSGLEIGAGVPVPEIVNSRLRGNALEGIQRDEIKLGNDVASFFRKRP